MQPSVVICPKNSQRVTIFEWDGSCQCGVFNITRCKSISVSLHKRRPPLSMHTTCEIVYTTKIHNLTLYCFKVFFIDTVALVCMCLNSF